MTNDPCRDVHNIVERLREVNPDWRANSQLAGLMLVADFEAVVHGGAADSFSVVDEILSFPAASAEFLEGFVSICQVRASFTQTGLKAQNNNNNNVKSRILFLNKAVVFTIL